MTRIIFAAIIGFPLFVTDSNDKITVSGVVKT